MSRILGIVSEYNPFHNGHLYQLQKSKKLVNPDYSVCVMSGNFTQRGGPSLIDKWSKAEMAIKAGFDMVIELPTVYSISSAENFAEGAIKLLSAFPDVTLSFGSEVGSMAVLDQFADIFYREPKDYSLILKHELQKGFSYPKARENAILFYLNDVKKYSNILSAPNNVLAIEYLKAIKKLKSRIFPITIKRVGTDYNSLDVNGNIASATAIRKLLANGKSVKKYVPSYSYDILRQNHKFGKLLFTLKTYEKEIMFKLRTMSLSEIASLQDVSEGLENAIKKASNSCNNIEDFINAVKSKRYTRSRIQRILLYALLNITKSDISDSYKVKPYIRVLAISEKGKYLLSEMHSKKFKYPVITSVKKFLVENNNKTLENMLLKDILATNIYTLGYGHDSQANLDYTKKLIIN